MNERTHVDLFTGIGGFALAAKWCGLRTVAFAETDPYASEILKARFSGVPNYGDVRNVPRIPCTLITCGDPCQRNSNAWRHGSGVESPAVYALQVVAKCRPPLFIRENPSVTRRDAPWPWHVFRAELEALGYAVLPIRVRACCLGADHRRERLFLCAQIPDANRQGLEGYECEKLEVQGDWGQNTNIARPDWGTATPRVLRSADGVPERVDCYKQRIHALGNAVCPQVAAQIIQAMIQSEGAQ